MANGKDGVSWQPSRSTAGVKTPKATGNYKRGKPAGITEAKPKQGKQPKGFK